MTGTKLKRGPVSKYTKSIGTFIASKVADGYTLKEIYEKYKDQVPCPKTMVDWKKRYPEFKEEMDEGYRQQLYNQMDEINDLSKELLKIDEELKNKIEVAQKEGSEELMKEALMFAKLNSAMLRDRRDNIRIRIDTIKFNLAKMAAVYLKEFREASVSKQPTAQIAVQIVNYKDIEDGTKKLGDS